MGIGLSFVDCECEAIKIKEVENPTKNFSMQQSKEMAQRQSGVCRVFDIFLAKFMACVVGGVSILEYQIPTQPEE